MAAVLPRRDDALHPDAEAEAPADRVTGAPHRRIQQHKRGPPGLRGVLTRIGYHFPRWGPSSCRRQPAGAVMKTQGEVEAAVGDGVGRFEQEYMGRGPKEIHAHLIGDLLVVRLT